MNLTVLLPCLNEEKTIADCITQAKKACEKSKLIDDYEILVADNCSTDYSADIAKINGARVIYVFRKGYGITLRCGIKAAKYPNILMADADMTYEIENLDKFIKHLDKHDIVIGDRFTDPNISMSFSHFVGNKFLSALARRLYNSKVRDFHCGIRAFKREKILSCKLHKSGMDFASEMMCIAEKKGLKIKQVPTVLRKNIRPAKLRVIRDGLLHLKFLISYC